MIEIRCNKEGCNKLYTGESFDQVAEDNGLKKAGIYYYCPDCLGVVASKFAFHRSNKVVEKRESLKQEIKGE